MIDSDTMPSSADQPTRALLLASPLVIVPTFLVPIYVLLHLISVRFLVASRSAAEVSRW